EALETCRAARDVGIRIAFVVPMRDRNYLVYEGDNRILNDLDPADARAVRERLYKTSPPPKAQVAAVNEIASLCENDLISVQFGPYGVEWTTDALRELVAEDSARSGRRIHIHCQETKLQRQWIDARYPGGFANQLDAMGFLSDRLTIAHGVWLTRQECEKMAERGVIVSVNTSSNLRLRSGIAPVAQFIETGMPIGLGIDTLALDDDDDAFRELRLTYRLHAGTSFDELLTPERLFKASMCTGACAVTGRHDFGTIAPNRPADFVVLDYARMAEDVIDDSSGELEVLLSRATKDYVRSVVVDGREVVRDGLPTGVDYPALRRELAAQVAGAGNEIKAFQPILRRYQEAIRAYFRAGRHTQVAP
ncbi:MAG: amidohydrolase family protein, partial [Proteobacteria bacterium]|nr:amidohydrolase family protein [Pseudomonadota bacterium]